MAHANLSRRPADDPADRPERLAHGVIGNERLAAATGAILFFLLAAQGLTLLLGVGGHLTWHEFIGMTLIGPVTLKLATTTYRFARYYLRSEEYVRRGPPHPFVRALGPLLGLATISLLGTGVTLYIEGRDVGPLLLLHQASFFVWVGLFGLHLLVHLWKVPGIIAKDLRVRRDPVARRAPLRAAALLASLVAGVLLATSTVGGSASFEDHGGRHSHSEFPGSAQGH